MYQTLVIGSTVVDIIITIDHLPVTSEDIHVQTQTLSLGGCAYLTSDILRLCQVPYTLCSPVGQGVYGKFVNDKLKEKGVYAPIQIADRENGCCYCMVEASGERTFISYHGVEYTFHESYLNYIDTSNVDSVYICGLEIEEPTGSNIITYLEKHPEYTIYFAPGPRILSIHKNKLDQLFNLSPIIHLNEQESIEYTGTNNANDAAKVLYALTGNTVIITLGSRGSYCYDNNIGTFIPGVKAQVVDTIGAGDAHIGAVIAARRLGFTFTDALSFANRVAAKVVGVSGGQLSDDDFEDIRTEWNIPNNRTMKTKAQIH